MKPGDPDHGRPTDLELARLEDELARVRPCSPSPQLMRRLVVLRARSADQARPWPGLLRAVVLTGVAAGIVAAAFEARLGGGRGEPGSDPTQGGRPSDVRARPGDLGAAEGGGTRFRLSAYRRALTRSLDDFDALLARDAADRPAPEQPPSPVFAFGRPGASPRSHEGDF